MGGRPYIELEGRFDLEFYPLDSGMVLSRPALMELGHKYPDATGCAVRDSAFLQFDAGQRERFIRDLRGCMMTGVQEEWDAPLEFPVLAPVLSAAVAQQF